MERYNLYLGIIVTIFVVVVHGQDTIHKSVFTEIFKNYDKFHIPVKAGANDSENFVTIKYGLSLRDIIDFDLYTGIGEFIYNEYVSWSDYRLSWDPLTHGNVTELRVPYSDVWNPQMTLYNSLDHEEERKSSQVALMSDGSITCGTHMTHRVRCDVDPKTNVTTCTMKFGTWGHDGKHIRLSHYYPFSRMDVQFLQQHRTQFKILTNEATYNKITYPCCPGVVYPDITYKLTMDHSKRIRSSGTQLQATSLVLVTVMFASWLGM